MEPSGANLGSEPRPIPARFVRPDDMIAIQPNDTPIVSVKQINKQTLWRRVASNTARVGQSLLTIDIPYADPEVERWTTTTLDLWPENVVIVAEPAQILGLQIARLAWHLFRDQYDLTDPQTVEDLNRMWRNERNGPQRRYGSARRAHELLSAAMSGENPPLWP